MKPARNLRRLLDGMTKRARAGGRTPLRASVPRSPAAPVRYSRLLTRSSIPARAPLGPPAEEARLDALVGGAEVAAPDGGRALLVATRIPAPCSPPPADAESLLFIDIESTGLGCSPLFLIGAMSWEAGDLDIRQYLARDYSEEAAVISLFREDAGARRRFVSFNGKSYDVPFIRMRAAATGVRFGLDLPHTDLLHAARRAWGEDLPDCRLQTIERRILGRGRTDDIPGAEIPDAYHAFVRTGHAGDVARIITHNRRDLVTLAEIMDRLEE